MSHGFEMSMSKGTLVALTKFLENFMSKDPDYLSVVVFIVDP